MTNQQLQEAIEIAIKCHDGQVDKSGELYILHPLRVMNKFWDNSLRAIAVMHDCLEDNKKLFLELTSNYNYPSYFKSWYTTEINDAIIAISRKENEKYDDYIRRCAKNDRAREVKINDLYDNLTWRRWQTKELKNNTKLKDRYGLAIQYLEKYRSILEQQKSLDTTTIEG